MRIIVTKDYQELGNVAAQHLLGTMFGNQNRVNLAITAGATPKSTYEQLVPEIRDKAYLNHVHYYNFDEIPYKKTQRDGITLSALKAQYFEPANISESNIHPLTVDDVTNFDQNIQDVGGLDLILMGIGEDGHFCGNMPGTTQMNDLTTLVPCTPEMKSLLANMLGSIDEAPDEYVTMGPQSVMRAKQLVLIANGKHKAEIMKKLLTENISSDLPASILTLHPNLVIIMDEEAASLVPEDRLESAR